MGEGGGDDMKSKTDHGSKQGGKTRSLTEIYSIRGSKRNAETWEKKTPKGKRQRGKQLFFLQLVGGKTIASTISLPVYIEHSTEV